MLSTHLSCDDAFSRGMFSGNGRCVIVKDVFIEAAAVSSGTVSLMVGYT